jgi:hypothetical protein
VSETETDDKEGKTECTFKQTEIPLEEKVGQMESSTIEDIEGSS